MSTTETVTARYDTFVREATPTQSAQKSAILKMTADGASDSRRALIYFPLPGAVPDGATVVSATLRVWTRDAWAGTTTLTARRITGDWDEKTTWNTQPTVTTAAAGTASVATPTKGQEVTIDVTADLQAVAAGANYYGYRLSVDSLVDKPIHSSESSDRRYRPKLSISYAKIPSAPGDLYPSGSRAVSASKPDLLWKFSDNFGDKTQAESQVQILNRATGATQYDSGYVANTEEHFDMLNPPTGAPAVGVLTAAGQYKWRVRVKDGDGKESPWSDYERFDYQTLGTLAITNPPVGGTVEETTPPITATLTGRTVSEMQIELERQKTSATTGETFWKVIDRQPRVKTTSISYTLPPDLLREGVTYRVTVWAWDTVDREALPGAPDFAKATRNFTYVKTSTPAVVTSYTVTANTNGSVTHALSRTARPDYFSFYQDGEPIRQRVDPLEIETVSGGTNYSFVHWGATPNTAHSYVARAVVTTLAKLQESADATASATTAPPGIRLVIPNRNLSVFLSGQDEPDLSIGEAATSHEVYGRRSPSRTVDTLRGYEGSISGELNDWEGVTAKTYRSRLEEIKSLNQREDARLIFGSLNLPVLIEDMSISPIPPFGSAYSVSFSFTQTGEFFELAT